MRKSCSNARPSGTARMRRAPTRPPPGESVRSRRGRIRWGGGSPRRRRTWPARPRGRPTRSRWPGPKTRRGAPSGRWGRPPVPRRPAMRVARALARSRGQVAGARSGTGFAEAVEQLARLAESQGGLNGQAQGLLPLMGLGGQAVLEQLRALATRQRALAEQLERLQAAGGSAAAGPLAEEARELARQLEAGRLDRQTIERQSRLYRRLLDAGRTLTGPEPDDQKERVSRPAIGDSVHLPGVLAAGATGAGPKLRYPTWEELARLTPEQRRLVLEYFRLINAPQH